jgi:two-component system, NarL family, response regulator NreC
VINVVLAEDHSTVREGLKILVNSQQDMTVVGEASNGIAAIKAVKDNLTDVVVMDITMPQMNGLKATRKIKSEFPKIKILALTRHADDSYLRQLLGAGADGYILKQSAPAELINAIRIVGDGGSYIDSSLAGRAMQNFARGPHSGPDDDVTPREMEVIRLVAWGYSTKEIAAQCEVSVKTAEAAKSSAMQKLHMKNRIDIVRYAITQGWLEDT